MPRGVPCVAFRDGSGKLDRPRIAVATHGRDRVRSAALRNHVARASFALATLGGHAEFELDFVKGHARARMARDFAIGHSTTYTDDHDEAKRLWLAG